MKAEENNTFDVPTNWQCHKVREENGVIFYFHDPEANSDYKLSLADWHLTEQDHVRPLTESELEARRAEAYKSVELELTKRNSLRYLEPQSIRQQEVNRIAFPLVVLMEIDACPYRVEHEPWPYGPPRQLINLVRHGFKFTAPAQMLIAPAVCGQGYWVVTEFQPCNIEQHSGGPADQHLKFYELIKGVAANQVKILGTTTETYAVAQRLEKRKKIAKRTAQGRGEKGGRPQVEAWKRGVEIRAKVKELQKTKHYSKEDAIKQAIIDLGLFCGSRTVRKIVKSKG